jgi:hypothetical protein
MKTSKYPAWQEPYQAVLREAALRETDPQRLTELVLEAEGVIFARMLTLETSPDENNERRAIRDACDHLLLIKTDVLKWPEPHLRPQ